MMTPERFKELREVASLDSSHEGDQLRELLDEIERLKAELRQAAGELRIAASALDHCPAAMGMRGETRDALEAAYRIERSIGKERR